MPSIIKLFVLSICLPLFACSTTSQDDLANLDADTADTDPNKVICKKERQMGSHFKKVVCRTLAEIKREQDAANAAGRGPSFSSSTAL